MFRETIVDMWVKADNIWSDDSTNLKSRLQQTNQAKHTMHIALVDKLKHLAKIIQW
jgi:hypothetical protein